MYHFTRAAKDHEGRTKKDREDIRRLEKENEELKEQVAILSSLNCSHIVARVIPAAAVMY